MKLFAKDEASKPARASLARVARDMHTSQHHLEFEEGKPLCGKTSTLYGTREVTPAEVLQGLDKQHAGWKWCAECGEHYTGVSAEVFTDSVML